MKEESKMARVDAKNVEVGLMMEFQGMNWTRRESLQC